MLNNLQVSQLSTANHDSSSDVNSDDDASSEYDKDGGDEEEVDAEGLNTLVVSNHFSKNIFSALNLQTTLDAPTTTIDKSATLSKYSLGVCNHCVSSCKWVVTVKSMCACCHINNAESPYCSVPFNPYKE